jgi:hypothetical protein
MVTRRRHDVYVYKFTTYLVRNKLTVAFVTTVKYLSKTMLIVG